MSNSVHERLDFMDGPFYVDCEIDGDLPAVQVR